MRCTAGLRCSLLPGFMHLWATGSSELVSGFLPKASGLWILVKSVFPVGEEWHPAYTELMDNLQGCRVFLVWESGESRFTRAKITH